MRHVLFVCGKNRLRSPTAEAVFSGNPGFDVCSAGTAADAACRVSGDLIEWADDIVVMETRHGSQIRKQFSALLKNKRLIQLDIPDEYSYMQLELVELLQSKSSRWMR